MNGKTFLKSMTGAVLATAMSSAMAGGVLDTGKVTMGVKDDGSLGFGGVGINLTGGPGDAIIPGCLCEGWGTSAGGSAAYTYGASSDLGIVSASFTAGPTAAEAVSTTMTSTGLEVTHTYSSAAGGTLFKVDVSIENTTGSTLSDVRYSRTLDWDVPPGHFTDDFTTIYGGSPAGPAGAVLHTSFDPFDPPNPLVTRGFYGAPADSSESDVTGDRGAYFILGFGDLDAGESHDFTTYIGADFTTAGLLDAFADVAIEAYSYTYDNDGTVTYGWGFAGLGLDPAIPTDVTEPGTLALLGLGILGLGAARRKKAA